MIDLVDKYDISGVVKRKRLYLNDYKSQISPYDLGMVWGNLDSKEMDNKINYTQVGRWLYYKYSTKEGIDGSYIRRNSSNIHVIPKNNSVLDKIKKIHEEDYVRLTGYLVIVHFGDSDWTSSFSRDDTGGGACEVMYVEDVEFLKNKN